MGIEKPFDQVLRRKATRIPMMNADNCFAYAENTSRNIRIISGYYLYDAIGTAQQTLAAVLGKARFWERFAKEPLNERQIKVLNRLLYGFAGKLTTSKWAKITMCHKTPPTATSLI